MLDQDGGAADGPNEKDVVVGVGRTRPLVVDG
jgi:hypothetical protein